MARLLTIHILEDGDRRISGQAMLANGESRKLTPFEAAAIWQLALQKRRDGSPENN